MSGVKYPLNTLMWVNDGNYQHIVRLVGSYGKEHYYLADDLNPDGCNDSDKILKSKCTPVKIIPIGEEEYCDVGVSTLDNETICFIDRKKPLTFSFKHAVLPTWLRDLIADEMAKQNFEEAK